MAETATGWGESVVEELKRYEDHDDTYITAVTRSGREILCAASEFELCGGWPAVWRLNNRFIPEPEILLVEVTGERDA